MSLPLIPNTNTQLQQPGQNHQHQHQQQKQQEHPQQQQPNNVLTALQMAVLQNNSSLNANRNNPSPTTSHCVFPPNAPSSLSTSILGGKLSSLATDLLSERLDPVLNPGQIPYSNDRNTDHFGFAYTEPLKDRSDDPIASMQFRNRGCGYDSSPVVGSLGSASIGFPSGTRSRSGSDSSTGVMMPVVTGIAGLGLTASEISASSSLPRSASLLSLGFTASLSDTTGWNPDASHAFHNALNELDMQFNSRTEPASEPAVQFELPSSTQASSQPIPIARPATQFPSHPKSRRGPLRKPPRVETQFPHHPLLSDPSQPISASGIGSFQSPRQFAFPFPLPPTPLQPYFLQQSPLVTASPQDCQFPNSLPLQPPLPQPTPHPQSVEIHPVTSLAPKRERMGSLGSCSTTLPQYFAGISHDETVVAYTPLSESAPPGQWLFSLPFDTRRDSDLGFLGSSLPKSGAAYLEGSPTSTQSPNTKSPSQPIPFLVPEPIQLHPLAATPSAATSESMASSTGAKGGDTSLGPTYIEDTRRRIGGPMHGSGESTGGRRPGPYPVPLRTNSYPSHMLRPDGTLANAMPLGGIATEDAVGLDEQRMDGGGSDPSAAAAGSGSKGMYACPIEGCGKVYFRKHNMSAHVLSHDGVRREYVCTEEACGKKFSRVHDLMRHGSVHTKTRDFSCKFCGAKFSRLDASYRHMRLKKCPPSNLKNGSAKEKDPVGLSEVEKARSGIGNSVA